jgi:hypothetical protein
MNAIFWKEWRIAKDPIKVDWGEGIGARERELQ